MKRLSLFSILAAAAMLLALANATTVAAQSQNLALGKNATQSTDIGPPFNASDGLAFKAVDGNTDGNGVAGMVTHTTCGGQLPSGECKGSDNPWWQVDLGTDFVVNRIQLWNRTDCCKERLDNFRIWVKSSTGNWENFIAGSGLHPFDPGEQYPLTFQGNKQARFIRVQIEKPSTFLSLAEVMVFGSPVSTFGSSNPSSSGSSVEDQLWDAVKNSQRVQDFQDYLRTYPNGQYATIANIKIRQLGGNTSSPPVNNTRGAGNSSAVEDQLWDTVKNSQRIQDFQDYLRTYPNGQYAAIANVKIRQLGGNTSSPPVNNSPNWEDRDWARIQNSQRAQDFQDFLRDYPNSQYAAIANIKIRQLSSNTSAPPTTNSPSWEDRDWARIQNSQRAQDFQDFLRDYPRSQYASIANIKIRQLSGSTSAPPVNTNTSTVEQQFWDAVKNSQRWQDFQGYLDNYPNGQYAPIARLKISQLSGSAGPSTRPTNPGPSSNAAFLNQLATTNKAKLPITAGDIQLFDSFSVCQSGCQQTGSSESVVIRARTPNLARQNVSIGQVEQSLKPAMVKGYCGSPEQAANVTMDIDVDDMFNQKVGHFFVTARDCGGNARTTANPPTTVARPSATGFQQVIAAAQPGSISEIARARKFFVASNDFSIKSKIAAAITKALPQMQVASTEQDADFLIAFELTDRTTGLVTPNDDKNANLRGELIVFTMIPAANNRPESIRILFRVTKERGFGVFSATPDENAAKEFAKQLAKVII